MDDQPPPTPVDHRTAIVTGLRAMADFIETRTEIPVASYTSVGLQYSVLHGSNEEKVAEVRRIAGLLGVEAKIFEDGTGVIIRYRVADRTTFTVHANLHPAAGEQS